MTAQRWWGVARLVLGLALLAFVVARTGALRLVPQLRVAPWLIPLFAAQGARGVLLEAARLRLLLRSQQVILPLPRAIRLCLTAVPFNYVIPGGVGGDVMKFAGLAGQRRQQGVELAAVVLVDRVTGLASLLLVALAAALASGGLATAPRPLQLAALAAALGLAALATVVWLVWSPAVRGGGLYRYLTTRAPLHRVTARVFDAFYAFREHRPAVAWALAMTVAGYVLLAGIFVLAAPAVMDPAPPARLAWIGLLALVANVLPITPGGLGVGEAAFAAAYGMSGVGGGAHLVLLMRLGVVPWAVVGALLYGLGQQGNRPTLDTAPAVRDGS